MTGNRHFRHTHGTQTLLVSCGDSGRQDASLTGWNASGKGNKGGIMPFMEFSDGPDEVGLGYTVFGDTTPVFL